jgi:hypothetical protein
MVTTESGMLTDDRLAHWKNAELPMLMTESGILTDERLVD